VVVVGGTHGSELLGQLPAAAVVSRSHSQGLHHRRHRRGEAPWTVMAAHTAQSCVRQLPVVAVVSGSRS